MGETIEYIFGNLRVCEDNVKAMYKAMKHQKRVNARVAIFVLGCSCYIALLEKQRKDEKAHMKMLSEELEIVKDKLNVYNNLKFKELDTQKGEAKM